MRGTIAKLFLKWPITKLVYPLISPWILYKAIWLYIYIHTCTIWCRRSWPAPSSPRFGSRRRTYCEDSGLSASELTLFSCGRTSQMRSSLSSISIAAFWSISRVGCPSLSMKHPMSTLWCSDPWLEPDWLRTEEFLSPHKDHTWTKAPNRYWHSWQLEPHPSPKNQNICPAPSPKQQNCNWMHWEHNPNQEIFELILLRTQTQNNYRNTQYLYWWLWGIRKEQCSDVFSWFICICHLHMILCCSHLSCKGDLFLFSTNCRLLLLHRIGKLPHPKNIRLCDEPPLPSQEWGPPSHLCSILASWIELRLPFQLCTSPSAKLPATWWHCWCLVLSCPDRPRQPWPTKGWSIGLTLLLPS